LRKKKRNTAFFLPELMYFFIFLQKILCEHQHELELRSIYHSALIESLFTTH
jgi:hypothetical protein